MDFRGWPENRSVLGVSGIRTRYQADGYDSIQREWTQFAGIVKLSGTTMMSKSLLPSQVYSNIHLRRFFVMKASGFHDSERFSNLMSKLFYGMRCISWYAGRTESEE